MGRQKAKTTEGNQIMNSSKIDPNNSIDRLPLLPAFVLIAILLACFTLSPPPKAFGVSPAPDGGYSGANTAEGTNALLQLTTGINNTAVGFAALDNETTGSGNTGLGYTALENQRGNSNNTALGAA